MSIACFIDPYKLMIMNYLSSPIRSLDGSIGFNSRYVAYNVHADAFSPSSYNSVFCAYDANKGQIKTWSMGTGKVQTLN